MRLLWIIGSFLLLAPLGRASSFVAVSPSVIEFSLAPGKKAKGRIQIQNPLSEPAVITVSVSDGWRQETGSSTLPPEKWLKFKIPKNLILPPLGKTTLFYRVHVPKDFTGETMAHLMFRMPPQKQNQAGMSIQMGHAIPLYLIARGHEKVDLSFSKISASSLENHGLEFIVTLISTGNVHVRPRGDILLSNADGLELERIAIENGPPILPNTTKQFFARSRLNRWVPGNYQAHLDLSYRIIGAELKTLSGDFEVGITSAGIRVVPQGAVPGL
ncbi:MAG: hypothetical protein IPP35_08925 [Elusimicrobia bacterium]|nr:hypothetical protein [Elusimicrobiota bacterium]